MAHYAFIDENNQVQEVFAGRDEDDLIDGVESWETYYGELRGMTCFRTSYTSRGGKKINPETGEDIAGKHFRFNFASIGFTYDKKLNAFIPPRPASHDNWVLNKATCLWEVQAETPTE